VPVPVTTTPPPPPPPPTTAAPVDTISEGTT
jgi:hypothetical protein